MAKNDEVDAANTGVPSADIPDLKKKEKERKRSGLAWGGARAPGGSFQGATGGAARAAASAASGSAGGVAAGAQAGAGFLAKVAALSLMGKMSALAGAVVVLGGGGLVGLSLLNGGLGSSGAAMGSPSLGGITSSVKVRSGGNDRIGVDSKGEIAFDPVAKAKPAEKKAEAPKPAEAAPATDTTADDMAKNVAAAKDRLEHNLSGAKLSGSLGGQFGGKNIFSGSGGKVAAPKFGESAPKFAAKGGKISAMRAGGVRASGSGRNISKGRSSRAIGQLRIARGMSVHGAQAATAEEAASGATNAFVQNDGDGGSLNAPGAADTSLTPTDLSGGAGGGSDDVTIPSTAGIGDIQSALDQIKSMIDQAIAMKKMGIMLIAIGLILIAMGVGPFTFWLIPIGIGLCLMGYMQLQKAAELAEKAKEMGRQLASRTGDFQSEVVQECVDQAIASGTSLDRCRSIEAEERMREEEERQKRDQERQKEISAEDPVRP